MRKHTSGGEEKCEETRNLGGEGGSVRDENEDRKMREHEYEIVKCKRSRRRSVRSEEEK